MEDLLLETASAGGKRSGERRAKILGAALSCFTHDGFARTTMEDIRHLANASTGSLYHHFKSKEQLAAELYVEGVRSYQRGLSEELLRQHTAETGIRAFVRYHLRWVGENPDWARYLLQSRQADLVKATEDALNELNREMFRRFAKWIEPFAAAGEVISLPADLYIALLIGPAQNYSRAWLSGRARTDPQTATRVLADAAWEAVRARAPRSGRMTEQVVDRLADDRKPLESI